MNLAKRDIKIENIKKVIENRKKLLRDNHKEINKILDNRNNYLNDILNEYDVELDNNIKNKQKQIDALMIISNLLSNIAIENAYDKNEINNLKQQQTLVLKEIDKIEKELFYMK